MGDGGIVRGEYDDERIRRLKAPLERAWASARGGFDRDDSPPPPSGRRAGRKHRALLAVGIITMSAVMVAVLAIPGAALLGRIAGIVSIRLGSGPGGKVVLPPIAQRSVIVDVNGNVIATLAEENRRVVSLAQVSATARAAVIAVEDARFYEHKGLDASGLLRALFANARAGRVREGGSTITQQLVKNILVGNQRTIDRKIKEAQYAVALERTMTKNQILELYLNETYFGNGAYGIEAASEVYFGTTAAKLDADQAALLAGLIRAPERYDPFENPKAATERRNFVIDRMVAEGVASPEFGAVLKKKPLRASKHPLAKAVEPYFEDYVKLLVKSDPRFGATKLDREKALFHGGLRIETTLDLKLQTAARTAIDKVLNRSDDPAAALVSVDPTTGAVKAMIGGKDFEHQHFNYATGNNRQPGSTFKMFLLTTALDEGISPGLTFDTPSPYHTFDDLGRPWNPGNYSNHGEGFMNMRTATEQSVNTYFVQLIEKVGPQKVVEMAHRLGITSPLQPYKSLALGAQGVSPYEMASAYGTLANNGVHCTPFVIKRVLDASGKVIARNDPSCERVLDATTASLATSLLQGVILRGTGHANGDIGRPAAGKTGTTDNYTDAWFMGFTRQFATSVWLGYPKGNDHPLYNIHGLRKVFGGSLPAMIWNKFMHVAHEGMPVLSFPAPPKTQSAQVPNLIGLTRDQAITVLDQAGFAVRTVFIQGTYAAGLVEQQSPDPGVTAERGTMVTIYVSDGAFQQSPESTPAPYPT